MPDPYRLLHEDAHLLAADKAAGVPVIPGRGFPPEEALVNRLGRDLGFKPLVVHRLDRETSGVLVFAKTPEAHRALCAAFEGRNVKKTYLAAVEGDLSGNGKIQRPLREFGSGRTAVDPRKGKSALTLWRAVRRLTGATLLEVEPRTGRRHQIRAHLYALGHPVLGDPLYGKERPVGGAPRLMLHALEIALPHPASGEEVVFRAEMPPDFEEEIRKREPRKHGDAE